jgi:N-acetylglucosamine kinase-like BadF-type ATPase
MAREGLKAASDTLREAMELIDDEMVQERLYDQSDQLARLATREKGPDHGRLASHMNALHELAAELDGEAAELVTEARASVSAYRETVDGV